MTPALTEDHTVIAWDAPGYGQSDPVSEEWRAPEYAEALAGFIQALGIERPHVVGHSFGSMLALSLFERHREVPASLILIGAYAGWAGTLPADEVARRLQMFLRMAEMGDDYDPRSYPGYFTDLIPADRQEEVAATMRENIRTPTIRAAGHIAAETDLRPMLSTIDIPTLVLHGAADARSPLAGARALQASIPRSRLVVLPSLGHACVLEDPQACAVEIGKFVRGVAV